ncbi:MAG: hypothetical protein WC827_04095 [Candidatus Paceibacterota bacterium]|jgi:hypothetical protein
MKIILNKTKRSSERYTLISGAMGSYGELKTSPNHSFNIANGIDKGNGYQGYSPVTYFLTSDFAPIEAKNKCKEILKSFGYSF